MNLIKKDSRACKLVLMFIILFSITSCDQYKLSTSNFSINMDSGHTYIFDKSKNLIVIDQLVVDNEIKGEDLFVLRMVSESIDCYNSHNIPTIITHYSSVEEYWHIGLNSESITGPFDKTSFHNYLNLNDIDTNDLNLTMPSTYNSNTNYFEKQRLKCVSKVEKGVKFIDR